MHGFCASGSYSQNPAGAFLGRIAVLVGSYQFLQKAHLFTLACFTLIVCHKAMMISSLKIIMFVDCKSTKASVKINTLKNLLNDSESEYYILTNPDTSHKLDTGIAMTSPFIVKRKRFLKYMRLQMFFQMQLP